MAENTEWERLPSSEEATSLERQGKLYLQDLVARPHVELPLHHHHQQGASLLRTRFPCKAGMASPVYLAPWVASVNSIAAQAVNRPVVPAEINRAVIENVVICTGLRVHCTSK